MGSLARLFLALVLGWLNASPGLAQAPTQRTASATLEFAAETDEPVNVGVLPWRFRAGDDSTWAAPTFDDAGWALLAPLQLADSVWAGVGWFRLHVRPDSALRGGTLALELFHLGASDVYLDGRLVQHYGHVSGDPATFEGENPSSVPLILDLDGRAEHVLAIRYAFPEATAALGRYGGWQLMPMRDGIAASLAPVSVAIAEAARPSAFAWRPPVFAGVLLLVALLHGVLFAYDPRDRANLLLALYASFSAVHLSLFIYTLTFSGTDPDTTLLLNAVAFAGAPLLYSTLMPLLLSALFLTRTPRWLWAAIGVAVVILVCHFFVPIWPVPFLVMGAFIAFELGLVIWTVWHKRDGARIAGTGIALLLAGRAIVLVGTTNDWLFATALTLGFLSLPVAMSVLVARRFARTGLRLEQELTRVEDLSEEALRREREKQALIASQNERLEAVVHERTAELTQSLAHLKATQQQLIHQEKLASLGQLTAGIAHEIKNPLNFVTNFADVSAELVNEIAGALDEGEDPRDLLAELKQATSVIGQHGRRADGIVKSMMQHARASSGEREAVDLNKLVAEHAALAHHGRRAQTPGSDVALVEDYGDGVGTVSVQPQELGRVIVNLVTNALDAVAEHARSRPAGGDGEPFAPRVTISTERTGDAVTIRVADNGPGIPDDLRARIFEPFFTTKPTGSGTGLGLSMSYDIVTQSHGGTLDVEDAPDGGAVFVVRLPSGGPV